MKPKTTDEVLELLDAPVTSAALSAALELGLFWLLEKRPMTTDEVAREFDIPPVRCGYWLELLRRAGLLDTKAERYHLSSIAQTAIVDAFSHNSWGLLAEETRQSLLLLKDLPEHISTPGSVYDVIGQSERRYLTLLEESTDYARRFTHMLFEIHQRLAEVLAETIDLSGVNRLMDLGGGSGVVSLALAKRYPELEAVVVDYPNVCAAGQEIAAESSSSDRVTYHAADFIKDELPTGFDMVVICDVDTYVYRDAVLAKVHGSLNPGGRLVIADYFAPEKYVAPPCRLGWAFEASLSNPTYSYITAAEVSDRMVKVGFDIVSERSLQVTSDVSTKFLEDLFMIEARR